MIFGGVRGDGYGLNESQVMKLSLKLKVSSTEEGADKIGCNYSLSSLGKQAVPAQMHFLANTVVNADGHAPWIRTETCETICEEV